MLRLSTSSPTLLTKVHGSACALGRVAATAVSDIPFVVSRAVNVLKGKVHTSGAQATPSWDEDSVFDKEKDKDDFRQYDEACDHVKEFYREQHGTHPSRDPNVFLSQLTFRLSPTAFG